MVGKFTSGDAQSHATGRIMRAYEVEVRFYAEIAPRVAVRHPRPLFAAVDPEEAWFTLLLEDVVGASQGDELAGCGAATAAAALRQMAGLHGPCWEAPDLADSPWVNRATPDSDAFTASIVTGVFPGFLERYGDRLDPDHVALLEAFLPDSAGGWPAPTGRRRWCTPTSGSTTCSSPPVIRRRWWSTTRRSTGAAAHTTWPTSSAAASSRRCAGPRSTTCSPGTTGRSPITVSPGTRSTSSGPTTGGSASAGS